MRITPISHLRVIPRYASAIVLAVLFAIPSGHAQKKMDHVLWADSTISSGKVVIGWKDGIYSITLRCDTCDQSQKILPTEAIGIRVNRGEVMRSVTSQYFPGQEWFEEIAEGELGLYRHKPTKSYYLETGEGFSVIPVSKDGIQQLFTPHIAPPRQLPEVASAYKYSSKKLTWLTDYANNDAYHTFPVSSFRLGIFGTMKGMSFVDQGATQESYVRSGKTYWSYGMGISATHEFPVFLEGWLYVENALKVAYNALTTDDSWSHFSNGIEIYSVFGQYRIGAKMILQGQSVTPYFKLGGGLNFLLYNDDTFLRVYEDAAGYVTDFGEIENFSTVSALPYAALGLEFPLGNKELAVELGGEWESYGNLDAVWTYYIGASIKL